MDCPSEENLIRMALQKFGNDIALSFDLKQRQLTVTHSVSDDRLLEKLVPLGLGATILSTEVIVARQPEMPGPDDPGPAKPLRLLLANNAAIFLAELLLGVIEKKPGRAPERERECQNV